MWVLAILFFSFQPTLLTCGVQMMLFRLRVVVFTLVQSIGVKGFNAGA